MSGMAKLLSAESLEDFERILDDSRTQLAVVHFSATWAPQCADMNEAMTELAKDAQYNNVKFVTLEAESVPEVSHKYDVSSVPTFVFIKDKKPIDRLDGANVPELSKKVKRHCGVSGAVSAPQMGQQKESMDDRLKKLVKKSPVMLFMKGTPDEPRCGFSRQIVQILSDNSVKFDTFNILADDDVRQGLKKFSNWPTYPQLYANGELLGGLDIVKELVETGELKSQLPEEKSLDDRLKSLINQSEVILFMKGNASTPRCGFSNTMIGLLNQTGVKYDTFDILSDEEVRQGLKKYSNWPTFPQLYVKGDLIGGLDIVKELQESGELESALKG